MSLDTNRDHTLDEDNLLTTEEIADGSVTNIKLAGSIELSKLLTPPEPNATADQTGAEIKTAYELEANTNAFTDAEQTKLSTVEARANHTGTQTASTISDFASVVGSSTSTFTNKTFDVEATGNSVTNIDDGNIKAGANIALSKLATDPLARANHTGTQTASTISDFATVVGSTTSTFTNKTFNLEDATNSITQTTPAVGEYLRDNGTKFVSSALLTSDLDTDPLARANHTGTQTASTISDFASVVGSSTSTFTNKTLDVESATNSITQTTPSAGEYLRDNGTKFVSSGLLVADLDTDPLARANHTGTQLHTTISDFDTGVQTNRLDQLAIPTATVDINAQLLDNVSDIAVGLISDETNTVTAITITDTTGLITLETDITIADAQNITFNSTTGTQIGTATTEKLAFYGDTPIVQPTALTTADSSTVDNTYGQEENDVITNLRTRVNELETKLQALGLIA